MGIKNTGMLRRVDELGRVVIPIEMRNQFGIQEKDQMEIFVEREIIMSKKYNTNCIFCGEINDLEEYTDKLICKKCYENIKNMKYEE